MNKQPTDYDFGCAKGVLICIALAVVLIAGCVIGAGAKSKGWM